MAKRSSSAPVGGTTDAAQRLDFWLDGDSVMCACPDCRAPMTIRLWLMIADCWQCGCSIELSAEQERRIQAQLQRRKSSRVAPADPNRRSAPTSEGSARVDAAASRVAPPHAPTSKNKQPTPRKKATPPPPRRQSPERQPDPQTDPLPGKQRPRPVPPAPPRPEHSRRSLRHWFDQMPAWLLSLLFHMALLALLALLMLDSDFEDPYITLSTEVNRWRAQGGEVLIQNPEDEFRYDLPLPKKDQPRTERQRQAIARANQDARELRVDPNARLPQLPVLAQVKTILNSKDPLRRTLAARDPRVRVEVVTREGGTTLTEAAVARGLRWMAKHQNSDGSWSLHRFSRVADCRGRCRDHGHIRSDSAATSLCLLPFLGAGQTHQVGIYQDTVAQGLRWLIQHQGSDGDLRIDSAGNAGMYAHGQGAIVLCEAYALTHDEQIREAAQRAIDFIVAAQHPAGGWRYQPGDRGDTSVFGWQLMALHSARAAGLDVPLETLELASIFLNSVEYDDGARYSYQPERRPTSVMTAEALLCRMYLGWTKDYAALDQGVKYLAKSHLPNRNQENYYYWYYATQVLHHYGGSEWKRWNVRMRDILVESQARRGHEAGSWKPTGGHAPQAGRLYSTALAVCTLEVYYRHAPIFRQLELE